MAKNKILEATNKVVAVLQSVKAADRTRVIDAALIVLGDAPRDSGGGGIGRTGGNESSGGRSEQTSERGHGSKVSPKSYVDGKGPEGKVEELAVAARYRELHQNADVSTKEELAEVLGERGARRNFDAKNFRRDAANARTSGLFTKGSARGSVVLSHYGQNYVDALPDREKVKALRKPKGAGRRSPARKRTVKLSSARR